MAKDDKLDALIFGDQQDTSQGEGLGHLDPIFDAPIGPSKAAKATGKRANTLFPEIGMTQGEEKAVATGLGAVSGPLVQKGMAKLFFCVNGVLTKPGKITVTSILNCLTSMRSDSRK